MGSYCIPIFVQGSGDLEIKDTVQAFKEFTDKWEDVWMEKELYSALLCDNLEVITESCGSRENTVFKPGEQSGGLSWGGAALAVYWGWVGIGQIKGRWCAYQTKEAAISGQVGIRTHVC